MTINAVVGYRVNPKWGRKLAWPHSEVPGVATDSKDRVHMFVRGPARVVICDEDGDLVSSWGEGQFSDRPHDIAIDRQDNVWCVDDDGHRVYKFTRDGKLLMTLGSGRPSDTGYVRSEGALSIKRSAGPFNRPTGIAIADDGELFVCDGYGNARVHRFSPDGELRASWGEPGTGPSQFRLAHDIALTADGRVLVADRESDRIQIFDRSGRFIEEWLDVQRPAGVFVGPEGFVYVAELWWKVGQRSLRKGLIEKDQPGRVSVLDAKGRVLSRWGGADRCAPGNFCAPHSICVDSKGTVYVGEVTHTFGVKPGLAPDDCHTVQMFSPA